VLTEMPEVASMPARKTYKPWLFFVQTISPT